MSYSSCHHHHQQTLYHRHRAMLLYSCRSFVLHTTLGKFHSILFSYLARVWENFLKRQGAKQTATSERRLPATNTTNSSNRSTACVSQGNNQWPQMAAEHSLQSCANQYHPFAIRTVRNRQTARITTTIHHHVRTAHTAPAKGICARMCVRMCVFSLDHHMTARNATHLFARMQKYWTNSLIW